MAPESSRPQEPVAPDGMEILFFYKCPSCGRHNAVPSPAEPRLVVCENCRASFPIIPIDEHGMHYIRIMLAGGKAAADPDFL